MDGLQVAVREVGGHLVETLLVRQVGLGHLLPLLLHLQAYQVLTADVYQLLGLEITIITVIMKMMMIMIIIVFQYKLGSPYVTHVKPSCSAKNFLSSKIKTCVR